MAGGWARDGAVQEYSDDTESASVSEHRGRQPVGESERWCVECGEEIPEKRREALPGVKRCVACQSGRDANARSSGINRRGSKDSQLR